MSDNKEKFNNNLEIKESIKKILLELENKKDEKESVLLLGDIVHYIEFHGILSDRLDRIKYYLKFIEKYTQNDWEHFLKYFMKVIGGYLDSDKVGKWEEISIKLLLSEKK